MTARPDAPELSAAERAVVDRIEAAPAAEESWLRSCACGGTGRGYCSRCGAAFPAVVTAAQEGGGR